LKIRRSLFVNIVIFLSFSIWFSFPLPRSLSLSVIGIFYSTSLSLSLSLRRNNGVCSSRMIVSKWDMLQHGERINQKMTLSESCLKSRPQLLTPFYRFYIYRRKQQKLFILNFKPVFIINVQSSTSSSSSSSSLFARSIIIFINITPISYYLYLFSSLFAFLFSSCNNYRMIPVRGI
jgi:hypothetical protein